MAVGQMGFRSGSGTGGDARHIHGICAGPALLLSAAAEDAAPGPQVLETLQGYNLLRTDRNGWIELVTDGEQLWVEVEKR